MDIAGLFERLPINVTDLAIILVILISGVFALIRGFVHEVLAIGSWLGAAIATLFAFPFAQPLARQYIAIPLVADIVTGVVIFLLVLVLLSILTHWIAARVQKSSLGALDRSLGLLFGLFRGALIVCAAWVAFIYLVPRPEDHPPWMTEARSLPLVEQGAVMLVSLVPSALLPKDFPARQATPLEDGQSFDSLLRPQPKGTAPDDTSGYKDVERKELQRLMESAQ